jgi:hypothetical protein
MIFIYTMFFMFLAHINISYPFIALILITTHMLSFTLIFFLIKGQVTKKVMLRGPCKGGLYPILSSLPPHLQKFASVVIKLSPD